MSKTIKFGTKVREKITGFVGVTTGKASYITGCDQYLVQPPIGDNNAFVDGRWFDEGRLEIVQEETISASDVTADANGCDIQAPTK
jgi:hypothetical protein